MEARRLHEVIGTPTGIDGKEELAIEICLWYRQVFDDKFRFAYWQSGRVHCNDAGDRHLSYLSPGAESCHFPREHLHIGTYTRSV